MHSHLSADAEILVASGRDLPATNGLSAEEVAYAELLRNSGQQGVGVVEGQHADNAPAGSALDEEDLHP